LGCRHGSKNAYTLHIEPLNTLIKVVLKRLVFVGRAAIFAPPCKGLNHLSAIMQAGRRERRTGTNREIVNRK